ncbi:MAG TPA: hypothetical protein C5S51_00895 [Methanosarcinaceae archaeon]|nr:hypothetical protein [Methanosarcinaceae archaeon]
MKQFESDSANVKIPEGYSMTVIKMYFWVGLVSAILLRALIIADHYSSLLSKSMWYLGVVGYLWFFAHRYHIAKRRFNVIQGLDLLEKIEKRKPLTEEDFDGLNYVMWSLSVSKERLNYLVIFAFSVIAIVLSLALDFGIIKL